MTAPAAPTGRAPFHSGQWVRVTTPDGTSFVGIVRGMSRLENPDALLIGINGSMDHQFSQVAAVEFCEPWTPRPNDRVRITKNPDPMFPGKVGTCKSVESGRVRLILEERVLPKGCIDSRDWTLDERTEFEPVFEDPETERSLCCNRTRDLVNGVCPCGACCEMRHLAAGPPVATNKLEFGFSTRPDYASVMSALTAVTEERTHPETPSRDELRRRRIDSAREQLGAKWEKK